MFPSWQSEPQRRRWKLSALSQNRGHSRTPADNWLKVDASRKVNSPSDCWSASSAWECLSSFSSCWPFLLLPQCPSSSSWSSKYNAGTWSKLKSLIHRGLFRHQFCCYPYISTEKRSVSKCQLDLPQLRYWFYLPSFIITLWAYRIRLLIQSLGIVVILFLIQSCYDLPY